MEKKQEPLNEVFQRGILNMLWIPIRTKQLRMSLKKHLAMKYLDALNTTYLAFIEHQHQKPKNTFIKEITETTVGPYKHFKELTLKIQFSPVNTT